MISSLVSSFTKILRVVTYLIYVSKHFSSKDEFGVRLDTTHRTRIADTIFKMVGSETYSQIFLVTHLDLAYADFKDTEVIDLTP